MSNAKQLKSDSMSYRFPALLIAAAIVLVAGMWWWSRPQPVPAVGAETDVEEIELPELTVPVHSSAPNGKNGPAGTGGSAKAKTGAAETRAETSAVFGAQLQDAMEQDEDEGLAEVLSGNDVPGWEPPPVPDETLSFVRDAFEEWRSSPQDEDSAAKLRLALAGKMPAGEMLAAASTLMRLGTVQDRLDAMWIVENMFRAPDNEEPLVRVNISDDEETEGGEGGAEPEVLAAEEREAAETHDVVALVAMAFEDSDPEVRQAAYSAAMGLSVERNNILLSQLLCSDSPASDDLRRQLMDELSGSTDGDSISLFIAAMQSPDTATAAAAKENLEAIAGRPFQDAFEAANWLEAIENPPLPADEGADFENGSTMVNGKTGDTIE